MGNTIIIRPEKKELKKGMETKLPPMLSMYKQEVEGICVFDSLHDDRHCYVYMTTKPSGLRFIVPITDFINNYLPNQKFTR